MKNKWKEKTKIEKNGIWFLTAGLEIVIAIQIYCNAKLLKAKQAIIDLKDEEIEHKTNLITMLLMRESRK